MSVGDLSDCLSTTEAIRQKAGGDVVGATVVASSGVSREWEGAGRKKEGERGGKIVHSEHKMSATFSSDLGARDGEGRGGGGGGGSSSSRPDDALAQNITEIFEIFSVRRRDSIDLADASVALRMLGVEISSERLRREVLPSYALAITDDQRLSKSDFRQVVLQLRSQPETQPQVDALFQHGGGGGSGGTERDKAGAITLKALHTINEELVRQGLEDTEYNTEQLEAMVQGVCASDRITRESLQSILQR